MSEKEGVGAPSQIHNNLFMFAIHEPRIESTYCNSFHFSLWIETGERESIPLSLTLFTSQNEKN